MNKGEDGTTSRQESRGAILKGWILEIYQKNSLDNQKSSSYIKPFKSKYLLAGKDGLNVCYGEMVSGANLLSMSIRILHTFTLSNIWAQIIKAQTIPFLSLEGVF